jgi:hypothetical protein
LDRAVACKKDTAGGKRLAAAPTPRRAVIPSHLGGSGCLAASRRSIYHTGRTRYTRELRVGVLDCLTDSSRNTVACIVHAAALTQCLQDRPARKPYPRSGCIHGARIQAGFDLKLRSSYVQSWVCASRHSHRLSSRLSLAYLPAPRPQNLHNPRRDSHRERYSDEDEALVYGIRQCQLSCKTCRGCQLLSARPNRHGTA